MAQTEAAREKARKDREKKKSFKSLFRLK